MLTKPMLTGKKVILRPLTLADASAMFASLSDEETNYLTGTQESFTFEQVEAYCRSVVEADDRADYTITRPGDNTYIGRSSSTRSTGAITGRIFGLRWPGHSILGTAMAPKPPNSCCNTASIS